ncbi:methyl-accepting chemotaxis protein [Paenibacillus sp.]|uniref:methyl-accepting chemotaxis protein n=1 Tax=Paenibacillus sp. TaxID=58172 RepID=UPI002D70F931|nr:methyl-accepting chemotaxis protein [Paenibacillus sp.]HZG86855.1 methyl-accepting chemotaxis protein [Paenibacillus sp.]
MLKQRLLLKQVKSVRLKTMLTMLPITIAIVLSVSAVTFTKSKQMLLETSAYAMEHQAEGVRQRIEKDILSHKLAAEALARAVEARFGEYELDDYESLFTHLIDLNLGTFGVGIFLEPNVQEASETYFSTYVYRTEDGGKRMTQEYSDPSYDYHNQDWYTIVGETGERGPQFTAPYLDEVSGITMLTYSVPIFDENRRFLGVVTGDIDLTTIQRMVAETKVGESGWAFLLGDDGVFLAAADTALVNRAVVDAGGGLAEAVAAGGADAYRDESGAQRVTSMPIAWTGWTLGVVMPERELLEDANRLLLAVSALGAAGIALLTAVIALYTKFIANRIQRVNRLSERMAEGDFTASVEADTADEFGAMANNFNGALSSIRGALRTVSDRTVEAASASARVLEAAEATDASTANVAALAKDIAAGAEMQTKSAKDSAAALEEMASGIQRIAESTVGASLSSNEALSKAEYGNEVMRGAQEQLENMRRSVGEAAAIIGELDKQSAEVNRIVEAIGEISTQTNLLALNAAIEAARAGAEGRGFAVVAGEVKKLALKTSESAEQVTSIVRHIRSDTVQAVRAMERGTAEADKGASAVGEAGKAFSDIQAEIRAIAAQMDEISASSEQLSAGSEQISATVSELSTIAQSASNRTRQAAAATEEQAASAQRIADAAGRLTEMMQQLQSMIGKFKT